MDDKAVTLTLTSDQFWELVDKPFHILRYVECVLEENQVAREAIDKVVVGLVELRDRHAGGVVEECCKQYGRQMALKSGKSS